MGCSTNSKCYSEKNVFQPGNKLNAIVTQVGTDNGQGKVESHNDLFLDNAFAEERGSVFDPADYYNYSPDSTSGLADIIQANAGAQ